MSGGVVLSVGGTWHAPQLASALTRHDLLDVVVTTVPPSRFLTNVEGDRPRVRWLPFAELVGPRLMGRAVDRAKALYWHATAFDRMVERWLRRRDPSLVVCFATFGLSTLTAMRERSIPTIVERGSAHVAERRRLLDEEHERLGIPQAAADHEMFQRELDEYEVAHAIAIPSKFVRASFEARGIHPSKLIEIPYGVDLDFFAPAAAHPTVPTVLTVGNLGVGKGTHLLLEAFSRLPVGSAELVLAGPLDRYCQEILAGVAQHVRWIGPQPRRSIPAVYRSATIFSLPSIAEGMSMAVLEAMACGIPVVVSDHTGYAGIVTNGIEGFVHRTGAVDELELQLRSLLQPGVAAEMGRSARHLAEQFGWSTYGDAIAGAYRSLLDD